jgi:Ubiquitin-2 like Rad60 SUMO-like
MSDHEQSPSGPPTDAPPAPAEHLNIKVTDGNNEVFFKIKRSTKLEKLMNAFCERQGKQMSTVRFLFDGQRVQPGDSPDTVSQAKGKTHHLPFILASATSVLLLLLLKRNLCCQPLLCRISLPKWALTFS